MRAKARENGGVKLRTDAYDVRTSWLGQRQAHAISEVDRLLGNLESGSHGIPLRHWETPTECSTRVY
jgi:hypothetical protein